MNFTNYTFSKSYPVLNTDNSIGYEIDLFDSKMNQFHIYINEPRLILVLVGHSNVGLFLNNSEIQLFTIFLNHVSYFNTEEENLNKCKIINLPNLIDPRFNPYLLEIPKYANIPVHLWDINFKQLIIELDPYFPENILLEKKQIDSSDILLCKLCNTGFIIDDNTNSSCKVHRGEIIMVRGVSVFSCCHKNPEEYANGCRVGYHFTNIT